MAAGWRAPTPTASGERAGLALRCVVGRLKDVAAGWRAPTPTASGEAAGLCCEAVWLGG